MFNEYNEFSIYRKAVINQKTEMNQKTTINHKSVLKTNSFSKQNTINIKGVLNFSIIFVTIQVIPLGYPVPVDQIECRGLDNLFLSVPSSVQSFIFH